MKRIYNKENVFFFSWQRKKDQTTRFVSVVREFLDRSKFLIRTEEPRDHLAEKPFDLCLTNRPHLANDIPYGRKKCFIYRQMPTIIKKLN